MKYLDTRKLFELLAEREDPGIRLVWRGLQAYDHFAHGHAGIVPALRREIQHFPEQVLGTPIVLKNLYEVSTLPHVLRDRGSERFDLAVLAQSHGNQQNLLGHGLFCVDLADRLP